VINYVCKSVAFSPFSAQRFVDTKQSLKMPLTAQTAMLQNGDGMTWLICGILQCCYFKLSVVCSFVFRLKPTINVRGKRYGLVEWKNNSVCPFITPLSHNLPSVPYFKAIVIRWLQGETRRALISCE